MAVTSSGSMPGACAPSTSTSTSFFLHSATSSATGNTSPVGDVTWSTTTSRVLSEIAPTIRLKMSAADVTGSGIGTSRHVAPARRADSFIVCRTAW